MNKAQWFSLGIIVGAVLMLFGLRFKPKQKTFGWLTKDGSIIVPYQFRREGGSVFMDYLTGETITWQTEDPNSQRTLASVLKAFKVIERNGSR